MKHFLLMVLGLWFFQGCGERENFGIVLEFPTPVEEAKNATRTLEVYSVISSADNPTCQNLLDGNPINAADVEDTLTILLPLQGKIRSLEVLKKDARTRLFFSQGKDVNDKIILRGCKEVEPGTSDARAVTISLIAVEPTCDPGWGNCDGDPFNGCETDLSLPNVCYSISGAVSGAIASGVTMNLTGASAKSTMTDLSGNYSFGNLGNGNYIITPTLIGYKFSPSSLSVTVKDVSVADQNFTVMEYQLVVLAGVPSGRGNLDGVGADARFRQPMGIAVDGSGNVYVADTVNNTIRKVTSTGVVSTLAGTTGQSGGIDGNGADARFSEPMGLAVDGAGNVYVADTYNNTIRKITPAGEVTTFAGVAGQYGSADGTGADARFHWPYGVAVNGSGNVYVADTYNNTIRKITADRVVSTLAGTAGQSGSTDATGADARFKNPWGVSVDGSGNVYVADTYNNTIRKITPARVVSTIAGKAGESGSANGTVADARFNWPEGVAVDGSGNVYVSDEFNKTIRKITPAGQVSTIAGTAGEHGSTDGTGTDARFAGPTGIAVDGSGNIYVADEGNNTIRKITPVGVVSTPAGMADHDGSVDAIGTNARFGGFPGVALDGSGNIYVADTSNHTIRKITPSGVVSTLAGTAGQYGYADLNGADARFYNPSNVALDSFGNIYVADEGNSIIRKITPNRDVSTLAGKAGQFGSTDATGSDARFRQPFGIAVDGSGNIYVVDTFNSTIRKINSAGVVTTIAGTAGQTGSIDAIGANARFNAPNDITVDNSGNLYVADTENSTIRKITPAKEVTTFAGKAGQTGSVDGLGEDARFNRPNGIAVDISGNIYVADTDNAIIRKITPEGNVSTVAGIPGLFGTRTGPLPAPIGYPNDVAIDLTNNYLIIVVDGAVLKVNL